MKYYKLDIKDVEKELETDIEKGLTNEEAEKRFRECGYNSQYTNTKFSFKSLNSIYLLLSLLIALTYLVFAIFKKDITFVYHSIAAAVIMLVCQTAIIVVRRLLEKRIYISSLNRPHTLTVLRDGKQVSLKYSEIMYGDIVFLEKGDYIPFDGIVLSSTGLVTDESEVTGNDRVSKYSGIIPDDNVKASELFNTVFCGSYVVHGTARVAVTDICARVYIVKSGKNNTSKFLNSSKIVDISSLFSAIFSLFCIIFTVICGLISKDVCGIITGVLLFFAVLVSGFMKTYSTFVFKKSYLNLNKKDVFLKSVSEIEALDNSDTVLINHDMIFEDKTEISAFLTDNGDFKDIPSINKSNFGPFLYASFGLESDSSLQKACVKILKKIGVDFSELNSMCPVFSRQKNSSGINICARAYDGNNLIIVVGNYNLVKTMCTANVTEDVINRLNSVSTEMLAVAVKKVDVIPNDLSVMVNGFTLSGVIGVNKKPSSSVISKCKILEKCGVHPIVLFPGNITAAKSAAGDNATFVSLKDFYNLSKDGINNLQYLCDYDGNIDSVVSHLSDLGYIPSYYGDKILRDKKCVAFKSVDLNAYNTKDADVITSGDFSSLYNTLLESKKTTYLINNAFGNFSMISAFYVICGVLYSLLFKDVMLSTLSVALILLAVMPMIMLRMLISGVPTDMLLNNNHSFDLLHNKNFSFGIVTTTMFLLICVIVKFVCPVNIASAFMTLTFVTYLCFSIADLYKRPLHSVMSLIPSLAVAVLFVTPLSFLFGVNSFGIGAALISIVVGIVAKAVSKIICRSVKI